MKFTQFILNTTPVWMRVVLLLALSFVLLGVSEAQACTVCFNGADKVMADSLNGAIFMMVGALFVVMGGIGCFVFQLVQRARNPIPDHLILADSIDDN